ncbi:hypothetical protein NBH00_19915 [Paraconexibacter antarcticus]|uniref:Uncharacterized protein n=1 Tax=Paraconexibacter antarcticus TaxID=2949664 RepID=A0ABY5DS86_9ACTN|nr:hypothetical protein [Paraconexibacter antarcticus]UTI63597.1 hypothetical protein NBH00_19915 [Paraconexibacter antarcticus]
MDDEDQRGRLSQGMADILNNVSSGVLFIFVAVFFLAGAIGGISLVSRLGGAGWFMYALVIGTYSLVFGPIIASAVTLRQNGSPKHRAELAARREQQRRKFGLHLREMEAAQAAAPADGPDAEKRVPASTSTSPAAVTNGPTPTDESVTKPGTRSPGADSDR